MRAPVGHPWSSRPRRGHPVDPLMPDGTAALRRSAVPAGRGARPGLQVAARRADVGWPSVAWTSERLAPPSIACEPWACRSQCGLTSGLMPVLMASLIIECTACSVSLLPPLRLAKTGSLTGVAAWRARSDQLPGGARREDGPRNAGLTTGSDLLFSKRVGVGPSYHPCTTAGCNGAATLRQSMVASPTICSAPPLRVTSVGVCLRALITDTMPTSIPTCCRQPCRAAAPGVGHSNRPNLGAFCQTPKTPTRVGAANFPRWTLPSIDESGPAPVPLTLGRRRSARRQPTQKPRHPKQARLGAQEPSTSVSAQASVFSIGSPCMWRTVILVMMPCM